MIGYIVPLSDSTYSEGRRYGHLYEQCSAVIRARARGGVEQVSDLNGRRLCGTCRRWRDVERRPQRVKVGDFYVIRDDDGVVLACPDKACDWMHEDETGFWLAQLNQLARQHVREEHGG